MTEDHPDTSKIRAVILQQIDDADDGGDDPALIGRVVTNTLTIHDKPTRVLRTFGWLFKSGQVYEAKPGHVRRTRGEPDDTDDDGS